MEDGGYKHEYGECYTIYDDSKHDVSQIHIADKYKDNKLGYKIRPKCVNSSRFLLIHEKEGIMLYEKESSSRNEWKFQVLIPLNSKESNIELTTNINRK